ncbi:MAG: hypothetical protein K6F93_03815 [Lachnospiraceae bacterium]|nr:hypothetical protein [Lachnospiraceae bacterium]
MRAKCLFVVGCVVLILTGCSGIGNQGANGDGSGFDSGATLEYVRELNENSNLDIDLLSDYDEAEQGKLVSVGNGPVSLMAYRDNITAYPGSYGTLDSVWTQMSFDNKKCDVFGIHVGSKEPQAKEVLEKYGYKLIDEVATKNSKYSVIDSRKEETYRKGDIRIKINSIYNDLMNISVTVFDDKEKSNNPNNVD